MCHMYRYVATVPKVAASRPDQVNDFYLTPWPLVRKRTIPTERPPLVGEI
jgi:hypothetical protein